MSFSLFHGTRLANRSIGSVRFTSRCIGHAQRRSIAIASAIYQGTRRDTTRRDVGRGENTRNRSDRPERSERSERSGGRVGGSYDHGGRPSSFKPRTREPRNTTQSWETSQSVDEVSSFDAPSTRAFQDRSSPRDDTRYERKFEKRPEGEQNRVERRSEELTERRAARPFEERTERPERSSGRSTDRTSQAFEGRTEKPYERRTERTFGGYQGRSDDRRSSTRTSARSSYSAENPYERRTERTSDRGQERSDDRRPSSRTPDKTSYPMSVPHTTAASQFLYGYSTVYAALRAGRRKSYTLYIGPRGTTRDEATSKSSRASRNSQDEKDKYSVVRLAREQGVKVVGEDEVDARLLDKMSDGRPHNGIVLEASPLPIIATTSLSWTDTKNPQLMAALSNGSTATQASTASKPFPFVLLIDDVLDPGNLGAILRSAYFLGVDAVLLTGHVAPFNAVLLKASAGAAEAMPMFRIEDPSRFLKQSREEGWGIVCATTPSTKKPNSLAVKVAEEVAELMDKVRTPITILESNVRYHVPGARNEPHINRIFADKPQILIIGGEGRGLRPFITKAAESFVEVLSPRKKDIVQVGLDSLNVSVAAGVVIQEVMARIRKGWKVNLEALARAGVDVESQEQVGLEQQGLEGGQGDMAELAELPSELDEPSFQPEELTENSDQTHEDGAEDTPDGKREDGTAKMF